jgi:hypothetical protein
MTVKPDEETMRAERGANPDPTTGEPGSPPLGTATGSASSAAAGAPAGAAIGGPVGAVVGGGAGAVFGAGARHAAGEAVNPTLELNHWKSVYESRPYYRKGRTFESYEPAYRYGLESAGQPAFGSKTFEEVELDLTAGWLYWPGASQTSWTDWRPHEPLSPRDVGPRLAKIERGINNPGSFTKRPRFDLSKRLTELSARQ